MQPMEVDFGPLIPHHLSEVVAGIVLLLLVVLVMRKYVVPRFEAAYEERTAAIQGGIESAERAQQAADAALAKYNAQLSTAREEAAQIREDAKAAGTKIIAEMRAQAEAEAARIQTAASAQIKAERDQAIAELRAEIGGMATDLAGRIVGESLTNNAAANRTVDRFLAELESQSAATK